jgi:hypothetical protein
MVPEFTGNTTLCFLQDIFEKTVLLKHYLALFDKAFKCLQTSLDLNPLPLHSISVLLGYGVTEDPHIIPELKSAKRFYRNSNQGSENCCYPFA